MPNYATEADIKKRYAPGVIDQLADDDGDGTPDAGVIDETITDAEVLIDGYCGERYATPFSPVPKLITKFCVDIAAYNLWSRRGLDEDGADKTVLDRYLAAVAYLKRAQEGKADLGPDATPLAASASETIIESETPIFGRTNMKGF